MKLFLLGKQASITHWLEDAAGALRAEGDEVGVGFTRRPWLSFALETSMAGALGAVLAKRIARLGPDLILVIGAYHAPPELIAAVAALRGRGPLVGWVGDLFDETARGNADLFDAVGYTDSGLLGRHEALGFASPAMYLPHAVNPHGSTALLACERRARMVFVANPTAHRRAVVDALSAPITLHGPGWRPSARVAHEIHARRVSPRALRPIYRRHLAALNIRNEHHVLTGLNQRNFEPCLAGAALLTDDQPDLERCFEPGREVLVWGDVATLNDQYERLLRDPAGALAIGEAGRRRVLAEHTYAARLASLTAFF